MRTAQRYLILGLISAMAPIGFVTTAPAAKADLVVEESGVANLAVPKGGDQRSPINSGGPTALEERVENIGDNSPAGLVSRVEQRGVILGH